MLKEYEHSFRAFEKLEKINLEREQDWDYFPFYRWYIRSLNEAGLYEKEQEISDLGLMLYPDNAWLIRRRLSLALIRSDSTEIKEFSGKMDRLKKECGWSEANYEEVLAMTYYRAGQFAESELHARKALELEPRSNVYKRNLSYVLVFDDLDPEEGLGLILEA